MERSDGVSESRWIEFSRVTSASHSIEVLSIIAKDIEEIGLSDPRKYHSKTLEPPQGHLQVT